MDDAGIKYDITRLKGLGEVEPDILFETAINPETRVVTQVTVPDAAAALESLTLIFGNDTGVGLKYGTTSNQVVLSRQALMLSLMVTVRRWFQSMV